MYLELGAAAYLLGDYAYHRWIAEDSTPPKPKPAREIDIPRTDDGAAIPMIYGRCRVRSPWLAWTSAFEATPGDEVSFGNQAAFIYSMDMFFVLGIPFPDGDQGIHNVFVDDLKLLGGPFLDALTGDGGNETPAIVDSGATLADADQGFIGQCVEFLNGKSTQQLCNQTTPFAATTAAGQRMAASAGSGAFVPGFRGYLSALLHNTGGVQWFIGSSPRTGAYSFECSSYPTEDQCVTTSDVLGEFGQPVKLPKIGLEANPADVLRDVLVSKLGVSTAYVDDATFAAAGLTLYKEGDGYSRAHDDGAEAGEVVEEILKQIDGVLREDPATGKVQLKLIRADWDPSAVPLISPACCDRLENFSAGGRSNLTTKIRIVFSNRDKDYQDDSEPAHNQAAAAGQDGVVREIVIRMPGICTAANARAHATRELSARSRPIARFRATCDRTGQLTTLRPGDPVVVTWPRYGVSEMACRVAHVGRGQLGDDKISLDLIQDFVTVHRGTLIGGAGTVGAFPHTADPNP